MPDKGEHVKADEAPKKDSPVVDACSGPSGYWLLSADGTVLTSGHGDHYGDAAENVSGGATPVAIVASQDGKGYGIVLADGKVVECGTFVAAETPPE
jgi:hypothetical protein